MTYLQNISHIKLIIISVMGILVLGCYGVYFNEASDALDQQKYHAAARTGETVCIAYITIIRHEGNLYTGVDRRGREYQIQTNEFQPAFYNSYAFSGKMNKQGYLLPFEMKEYPFRKWKYILSALSILLVGWLVWRHLRIDMGERQFYFQFSDKPEN